MWKLVLEDLVLKFISVAAEVGGCLINHSVSIFLLPCVRIDTWNENIHNHTCIHSDRLAPVHIIRRVHVVLALLQLFMIEPLRRGILLVDGAADNVEEELLNDEKPESEVGVILQSPVTAL